MSDLRVLYIGGTGTISTSCVRLSLECGMRVYGLNRGNNRAARALPEGVTWLKADITDEASTTKALEGLDFDAVVNFLSYDAGDAERSVRVFGGRTKQYVQISSASVYGKPVLQIPIVESTPTHNRFLEYAPRQAPRRTRVGAGEPRRGLPGHHRAAVAHLRRCQPAAPGGMDGGGTHSPRCGNPGTRRWDLAVDPYASEDFAVGLVGLLGNPRAIGETFHITGGDIYTWDQIYTIVADALGVQAKLVHVASELFPVVAPDWFWSDLLVGDLAHSAVFDNSKIHRFVPSFAPRLTFHRAAERMVDWHRAHPDETRQDEATDAVLSRVVDAYHAGRKAFADLAPRPD